MYNGQDTTGSGGGDFVSLGLQDGFPEFKFNIGSGPMTIKGTKPLELGKWHTVKIARFVKMDQFFDVLICNGS